MQRWTGVAVEVLGADEIGRRWSHLATERLVGATFCGTDGFLLPSVIYGDQGQPLTNVRSSIVA
jgi:hypothetical protein